MSEVTCQLRLYFLVAADVDPLSQGGVKMDTEVVDVRQWLRALQTWDGISTEERQVRLWMEDSAHWAHYIISMWIIG